MQCWSKSRYNISGRDHELRVGPNRFVDRTRFENDRTATRLGDLGKFCFGPRVHPPSNVESVGNRAQGPRGSEPFAAASRSRSKTRARRGSFQLWVRHLCPRSAFWRRPNPGPCDLFIKPDRDLNSPGTHLEARREPAVPHRSLAFDSCLGNRRLGSGQIWPHGILGNRRIGVESKLHFENRRVFCVPRPVEGGMCFQPIGSMNSSTRSSQRSL